MTTGSMWDAEDFEDHCCPAEENGEYGERCCVDYLSGQACAFLKAFGYSGLSPAKGRIGRKGHMTAGEVRKALKAGGEAFAELIEKLDVWTHVECDRRKK